jgi:hypothetical protein
MIRPKTKRPRPSKQSAFCYARLQQTPGCSNRARGLGNHSAVGL